MRRERERESLAREFYLKNPTPNGSRPRDLIGLYRKWQRKKRPQPAKRSSREEGGGDRGSTAARPTLTRNWGGPQVRDPALLFKRETEHLCLRQLMHGIGRDPFARAVTTRRVRYRIQRLVRHTPAALECYPSGYAYIHATNP